MKIISESSFFRNIWDLFILILICTSTILIPIQIVFQQVPFAFGIETLYIIDVFFLIDIYLNFHTSYRYQGVEITDKKKTSVHYLKGFFTVDLLANLPFELLFLLSPERQVYNISLILVFRLFRLLRVARMFVILKRWGNLSWTNSGYLRIAKFCVSILLLIHCIACAWFVIPFIDNFPNDSWVVIAGIRDANPVTQYVRSLYWAVTTMTTVGYGDISPGRNIEYIFSVFVMLLGASIFAFIVGNIASLFSSIDAAKSNFWRRNESIIQHLRHRKAPHNLNERVNNYFEYLWDRHRGLTGDAFTEDLPKPLRLDILQCLTSELLEKVPLFRYCSPLLRDELLMALKVQIYAPGGYIVQEGEIGKEIFFISRGKVDIMSDNGKKNHGSMQDGDYFGDFSVIFNEKRTASVKALTYCEVFILTRDDFNRIKDEYSEFKDVLKKVSSEKTEKISTLVQEGIIL